jgi:hypothetical protein
MNTLDRLEDPSLLIVFLYEPMGLGHLRVTKALYEGLPEGIPHIMLGADDATGNYFHRFSSSYPLAKQIMERMQYGLGEHLATIGYRLLCKIISYKFHSNLKILLKEQITAPKTVLVVATHPGPGLQFAAIKKQFTREEHIKTFLVVQVTDDSPQRPWDIPGADIIFSPSDETSKILAQYHHHEHAPTVQFITSAYPIAPIFAQPLTKEFFEKRLSQADYTRDASIHVAIPISGAAVGLNFHKNFMHSLSALSQRFTFHIVAKKSPFTEPFLEYVNRHDNMDIQTSTHDRDVITMYEQLYCNEIIALEVTKPSEQTFKALTDPKKRGGSILLFADPVGRQEYDNINFLHKHHLLPSDTEMLDLCTDKPNETTIISAAKWRGLILPHDPEEAAQFTYSCLKHGIFKRMMTYQPPGVGSHEYNEVNPYGVGTFWKMVSYILE